MFDINVKLKTEYSKLTKIYDQIKNINPKIINSEYTL